MFRESKMSGADSPAEPIARYLAGLFQELATGQLRSIVVGMDLSSAPASGRAKRLVLIQCDTDGLDLLSSFRYWWLADVQGFRAGSPDEWPYPGVFGAEEGFEIESPRIRFATDGRRMRLGVTLGPYWYWVKEGMLTAESTIASDTLIDVFRHDSAEPTAASDRPRE